MEADRFNRIMEIFSACTDLPVSEHKRFLDRTCGDDSAMREEIRGMLAHDQQAHLDESHSSAPLRAMIDSALFQATDQSRVPESIGSFRIIREIGRGGMGIVYEGEQNDPKRRIAIKVVPGLASTEHRRRIRQEAQALALIESSGVARIYESGVAEVFGATTPYIVMELIEGLSIDQWVHAHDLRIDDRLVLIARVADAIQAAHGRGVIHRDLKPSNISVVDQQDGPGQPKVLDFGIAQLLSADFTAISLSGAQSSPMGTLQYMSPEQIQGDRNLVDSRSDIYALGLIAYELLSGHKALDMSDATFASVAAKLTNERPKALGSLNRSLRGDIEVVVSKAMEKEPGRRYQTMEAFAADLRRIFANEPIQARAPSLLYSATKFVRRNRAASMSVAVISVLLILGLTRIGIERGRAFTESQTSETVSSFIVEMLQSIDPNVSMGNEVSVREVLDRAAERIKVGELDDQPKIQSRLRIVLAQVYNALGDFGSATLQYNEARDTIIEIYGVNSAQASNVLKLLAQNQTAAGNYEEAEALYIEASRVLKKLGQSPLILSADGSLASVYYWTGRFDESERFLRDALIELEGIDPATDPRVGHTLSSLGSVLEQQGKLEEALEYHALGIESLLAFYGINRTEMAEAYNDYGNTLWAAGRYNQALDAHSSALEIRKRLLDPRHPDMAVSMNNIALVYIRLGRPLTAIPILIESVDIRMQKLGRTHPATCSSLGNLARAYMESDQLEKAIETYDEAVDSALETLGPGHTMAIIFQANRGECLARLGRFAEAERILIDQYERAAALLGENHFRSQAVANQVADMYSMNSQSEQEALWRERVENNE